MAKYLAGKWATVTCPSCGERSCASPYVLAVLYIFYIWDVLLFGYVAFVKYQVDKPGMAAVFATVMVVGWLILDFFSLYVPLARMKKRTAG